MNIPVDEIQSIEFSETPTKQSSQGRINDYDIVYDFPMQNGVDHKRYCVLLLRVLFSLKKKQRIPFLIYQCKLVNEPFRWLNSVYLLLDNNWRIIIQNEKDSRLAELIELVEEKRNACYPPQLKLENHNHPNESGYERRIRWRGTTSQLVHMYFQTLHKEHKGKTLIDMTTQEMVEMISKRYVKIDGTPFNEETLRSYLKPSKADKHPNFDQQIQIPNSDEK